MAGKEDRTTNVISDDQGANMSSILHSCRFEGCNSTFKKHAHLSRHELIHNDIVSYNLFCNSDDNCFS